MLYLQLGITVGFAVIAGSSRGAWGRLRHTGRLTNVFASLIFVFVANFGLRHSNGAGLLALLRAELIKLCVYRHSARRNFKFYDALVVPALFATFLVTLLAWRQLCSPGSANNKKNRMPPAVSIN